MLHLLMSVSTAASALSSWHESARTSPSRPPVLLLPPVVAPLPEQDRLEIRCKMANEEERTDLDIAWELEEKDFGQNGIPRTD